MSQLDEFQKLEQFNAAIRRIAASETLTEFVRSLLDSGFNFRFELGREKPDGWVDITEFLAAIEMLRRTS